MHADTQPRRAYWVSFSWDSLAAWLRAGDARLGGLTQIFYGDIFMTKKKNNFNFDILPQRSKEHVYGDQGVIKFCNLFTDPWFIAREESRNDYGVDVVIEALLENGRYPTNIRIHAQIKSSNKGPNKDGSYSYSVPFSNLNYLLNTPSSFYVFYSIKEDKLYYCSAESVYKKYKGKDNITVRFKKVLDEKSLKEIYHYMIDTSLSIRDLLLSPNRRKLINRQDLIYTTDEEGKVILMHNLIWEDANGKIPEGYEVYHVNGDVYDNRRQNLALKEVNYPFPIEEFQIEVSNIQLYNVLSVILEGDSAYIVDDVPSPSKKMFTNIINSLISQGWLIDQDILLELQNRVNKLLNMNI